jgi:hypothetical protein
LPQQYFDTGRDNRLNSGHLPRTGDKDPGAGRGGETWVDKFC